MKRLLVVVALACPLAACEKPQTASARKPDTQAWDAGKNPFVASGWKSGDEASWESQIRERTAGQNEYPRVTPRR